VPSPSQKSKKLAALFWASVPDRGIVMETVALHGPRLGVGRMCRALAVPPATYYGRLEAKRRRRG
jgi:hypothetical protein